jgi:mannose-6-phosphate isomerase-like protein (cupin superfamily)
MPSNPVRNTRCTRTLAWTGVFLVEGGELPMRAGDVLIAPEGVAHGVRNTSASRLLLLAILSPAPGQKQD